MDTVTLTPEQIDNLARSMGDRGYLNFTNLANMRAVKSACKKRNMSVWSRTAHGSLLDPRYTVEGSDIPDQGLSNNYKQFQPKLYVLEVSRW